MIQREYKKDDLRDFEALEIGHVFNRNYLGKGCAVEGCKTLIQRAFSEGIHRIYAECERYL